MKNKNTPPIDSANPSNILAEFSPRDYTWESFQLVPGLPEVNHFGYLDSKDAQLLAEHRHPDTFEFVYTEKGKASWEINNCHYETKEGDLFYTRPDESHRASNNILEPCRLWHFGLRAPYISEKGIEYNWMQQNTEDIHRLIDGLYKLPRVTSLGSSSLHIFRRLARAIQQPGPHSRLDGRNAVIELILLLLETSQVERVGNKKINYQIEKLTNELTYQLDEGHSVKEMAARIGISVTYFYQLFLKYTGMTPRTYIERLRIKEACRRLTETESSITTISMDLDFATSQHFSRVFHRMTGRTPTQWRQNKMNADTWLDTYGNKKYDFISVREPEA